MMRVPVAYSPVAGVSFGGLGPLGLFRYHREDERRVAVLLRVTLVGNGEVLGIASPCAPSPGEQAHFMSRFSAAELAPWRSEIDVILRGTVDGRGEDESFVVQIDQWQRELRAASARAPVDLHRCVETDGAPLETRTPEASTEDEAYDDTRASAYQVSALRVPPEAVASPTPVLRLSRRTSGRPMETVLGGSLGFRLGVEAHERDGSVSPLEMVIDTVVFDASARSVEVIYRGEIVEPDAPLERFVVHASANAAEPGTLRDPMRAEFAYAVVPEDATHGDGLAPLMSADEREIALYSTWHDESPRASLETAEAARISAELLVSREPRHVVLERHGLTAYEWNLEEAALAMALGAAAHATGTASVRDEAPDDSESESESPPKESAADVYAAAHASELARHPTPDLSLREAARITAHLAIRAPERVLDEANLSIGTWLKVDAALRERLAENESARTEFEEEVLSFEEEARAARERDMPFLAEET